MATHVVIDGSNIATEGRSTPSLEQLVVAVEQFSDERPHDTVTVICDATFPNRIDEGERSRYEQLIDDGWLLTPPAGAIGRGDAFILQVAAKADATVLSNDSFQEFHGEHPWLFDEGRLVGGKPVDGVGWVFVDRLPVRGPTSRRAVKAAKDAREQATSSTASSGGSDEKRSGDGRAPSSRSFSNTRASYRTFAKEHPVGSHLIAPVEAFSSHGAYARSGDVWCYVPLKSLGDPPPRRARDVLTVGEEHDFVVTALHDDDLGVDVTLADTPAAADARETAAGGAADEESSTPKRRRTRSVTAADSSSTTRTRTRTSATKKAAPKKAASRATPKKRAATKTAPKKQAAAKKAAAKRTVGKKSAPKKAAARKTGPKKAAAQETVPQEKVTRKTAAKKTRAKKAAATKAVSRRRSARSGSDGASANASTDDAPAGQGTTTRKRTAKQTATKRTSRAPSGEGTPDSSEDQQAATRRKRTGSRRR